MDFVAPRDAPLVVINFMIAFPQGLQRPVQKIPTRSASGKLNRRVNQLTGPFVSFASKQSAMVYESFSVFPRKMPRKSQKMPQKGKVMKTCSEGLGEST